MWNPASLLIWGKRKMFTVITRCALLLVLVVVIGISVFPAQLGLTSQQAVNTLKAIAYPALIILAIVTVLEPVAWRLGRGRK